MTEEFNLHDHLMSRRAVWRLADENDIQPEELDEHVHQAASMKASSVNNGGTEEQVKFLLDIYGPEEVTKILEGIIHERE
jgi:hypothetical protein